LTAENKNISFIVTITLRHKKREDTKEVKSIYCMYLQTNLIVVSKPRRMEWLANVGARLDQEGYGIWDANTKLRKRF
jgi:hypothetical protein